MADRTLIAVGLTVFRHDDLADLARGRRRKVREVHR
jgi:hypothetical protein